MELSFDVPAGPVRAAALMEDVPLGLREPVTSARGTFRVRVHCIGRDTNVDLSVLEPVETYKIQMWPGPEEEGQVHKLTSNFGRERLDG